MLWATLPAFHLMPLLAGESPSIAPDSSSWQAYAFGWGPIGVGLVALGWLMFRGWRLNSPKREAEIRQEARADLLTQIERLMTESGRQVAEIKAVSEQRDDATKMATDRLIPLLVQFTATTQSLLPILQGLVSQGGWPHQQSGGGSR